MAASKYHVVYADLRERIMSGELLAHDPLGGEVALCKRYGVTRTTLRKAIERLKRDGLVHSRQGSGTYVNPPELFAARQAALRPSVLQAQESRRLLALEVVPADGLAGLFSVAPTTRLVRYRQMRSAADGSRSLVDAWAVQALVPMLDDADPPGVSPVRLGHACGHSVSHVNRRVRAWMATREEAGLLGVGVGDPLLMVDHYAFLPKGVLVQHACERACGRELSVTTTL